MSLLLEALKKAEKAKEDAQRRAREERPAGEPEELHSGAEPAESEAAEPHAAAAAEPAAPVLTRDKLPEISQKLEILTDDLEKPVAEPAAAPIETPRVTRTRIPPARNDAGEEASRASARKVFEAKFREPN